MKQYQFLSAVEGNGWCDLRSDLETFEVPVLGVLLVRVDCNAPWSVYQPNKWRVKPPSLPGYNPAMTYGVWYHGGSYPSWICFDGLYKWVRIFTDGSHRVYTSMTAVITDMDFDPAECIKVHRVGHTF